MPTRTGFIFLYVLGLISVTLALAFALLSTAQLAQSGATKTEMDVLANRAAREGVQHAIAVIHQDFVNRPGVPTQMSDRWRSHFWPIDATKIGYTTVATSDDAPIGREYTPEDYYQNDVPVENFLTEPYLEVDNNRGHYIGRIRRYERGHYNHPGLGRWFEPGVHSNDPVARPLSFHLSHPTPPAGSPDPAVAAGENYAPDLDEPMWYDSELRPTTNPAQRRYRLRYATAVECLAGHLLCTVPGEYDDTAVSILSGSSPTSLDHLRINEVNNVVADRYGGMMSNMFRYTLGSWGWEWGDLGLRGLGGTQQYIDTQLGGSARVLAGRDALGRMTHFIDAPGSNSGWQFPPPPGTDSRINHEAVTTNATYFNVGPLPSFQAIWTKANNVNWNPVPYLYTPFGRAPTKVPTPQAWYESRVDTPWRLNVPTLAPHALTTMVYAYMPAEFRTQGSDQKITKGWNAAANFHNIPVADDKPPVTQTSAPDPALHQVTAQAVEAFDDLASEAHFDRNGGVVPGEPYPGTNTSAPGSHWLPDLGEEVLANTALSFAGAGTMNSSTSYAGFNFSGETLEHVRAVGGHDVQITPKLWRWNTNLNPDAWGLVDYEPGFDADAGFYYHKSYWLDLSVAMIHAVAVARFSWLDRVNGAYVGDPLRGKPVWPASMPGSYFPPALAPNFTPSGATLDLDVDGDGIPDVPSTFDSIAEIDHQFLRNLGEWPEDYATGSRPNVANSALRSMPLSSRLNIPTVSVIDLAGLGSKNIRMLRSDGTITPQQAALMELVVNDMRMSFFGASPDYPDFRPIDLDDDGNTSCSCYATGTAPADPSTGKGPAPETWFSLTGCFVLEKSRYYRIFTRGQLFDEIRNVQVAEMNLESVYMVDPDGDMGNIDDQPSATPGNRLADSHLIFQRRLNNRYFGTKSHVDK